MWSVGMICTEVKVVVANFETGLFTHMHKKITACSLFGNALLCTRYSELLGDYSSTWTPQVYKSTLWKCIRMELLGHLNCTRKDHRKCTRAIQVCPLHIPRTKPLTHCTQEVHKSWNLLEGTFLLLVGTNND